MNWRSLCSIRREKNLQTLPTRLAPLIAIPAAATSPIEPTGGSRKHRGASKSFKDAVKSLRRRSTDQHEGLGVRFYPPSLSAHMTGQFPVQMQVVCDGLYAHSEQAKNKFPFIGPGCRVCLDCCWICYIGFPKHKKKKKRVLTCSG